MTKKFYVIGGGIGALNTVLLLLKRGVEATNITIFESQESCGGLFYRDIHNNGKGFSAHTVRTFDEPSYRFTEMAWRQAGIWNNNHLITRNHNQPRQTVPDDMLKVIYEISRRTDDELSNVSIRDILSQHITNKYAFRYFFHLTGLHEHHAALGLKRYMTHTHSHIPHNWLLRAKSCDYESIIEPIVDFLLNQGVIIETNCTVRKLNVLNDNSRVQEIEFSREDNVLKCINLDNDDNVILTIGANVAKQLLREDVFNHIGENHTRTPVTEPLMTSHQQPHTSLWVLAGTKLAEKIEALEIGLDERDHIYIDDKHPWQITLIALGDKYYRDQPDDQKLFYIAMNDLSQRGLHVQKNGAACSDAEIKEEVLTRLKLQEAFNESPDDYTATIDARSRERNDRDVTPIVRFMPGEGRKVMVYPDTKVANLAVIGERVKASQAPVPTTEWVTETGFWAILYLLFSYRHRLTPKAYTIQERAHSINFLTGWVYYKVGGINHVSSINSTGSDQVVKQKFQFPQSYKHLKCGERNTINTVKNLMQDYCKNNFLRSHWNRNHQEEAKQIILYIENNQPTEMELKNQLYGFRDAISARYNKKTANNSSFLRRLDFSIKELSNCDDFATQMYLKKNDRR